MSVTIEDKLWMASCFNEPLPAEEVDSALEWLNNRKDEDKLRDEVTACQNEIEAAEQQADLLLTSLNEQREFLVKVLDWLDNPSCKRAKIAEEVVEWLGEHP